VRCGPPAGHPIVAALKELTVGVAGFEPTTSSSRMKGTQGGHLRVGTFLQVRALACVDLEWPCEG
jgi:hypothetical protein